MKRLRALIQQIFQSCMPVFEKSLCMPKINYPFMYSVLSFVFRNALCTVFYFIPFMYANYFFSVPLIKLRKIPCVFLYWNELCMPLFYWVFLKTGYVCQLLKYVVMYANSVWKCSIFSQDRLCVPTPKIRSYVCHFCLKMKNFSQVRFRMPVFFVLMYIKAFFFWG